jgi:hypothetical protein
MKEWKGLLDLVMELEACGGLGDAIPEVLAVFERQPESRTISWAWDIEYALYRCPGRFEVPLIESARRCPSDFTIRVLGRIRARGRPEPGGVSIETLLQSIADRTDIPASLRELARAALRC